MLDRRGDCSPAFGIVVGVVASVGIVAAIAAWGERALYLGAWAIITLAEVAR